MNFWFNFFLKKSWKCNTRVGGCPGMLKGRGEIKSPGLTFIDLVTPQEKRCVQQGLACLIYDNLHHVVLELFKTLTTNCNRLAKALTGITFTLNHPHPPLLSHTNSVFFSIVCIFLFICSSVRQTDVSSTCQQSPLHLCLFFNPWYMWIK